MINFITMEQARRQVRVSGTEHDAELEDLRTMASGIILDYLEGVGDGWLDSAGEPSDIPWQVKAATLLVLGRLFYDKEGMDGDPISEAVVSLLMRTRMPTLR